MDSMKVVEDVVEGNKLSEGSNWHGEESCGCVCVCVCVGGRGGALGFDVIRSLINAQSVCILTCTDLTQCN